MGWSSLYKCLFVPLFLTLMFCVVKPEETPYGSITGRILHPDDNLSIRILSDEGVDTATRNPESQTFTFSNIKFGKCILQIRADGYGLFEEIFILERHQFICHDIVLARTPPQIPYLYPSNSQNLDSVYFSLYHSSNTDSGFQVVITFNDKMDSVSVFDALTVLPDTAGVQTELILRQSLIVHVPYWKLATIDTVKVKVGTGATNKWNDTLPFPFTIFYPVDTSFIRTFLLE